MSNPNQTFVGQTSQRFMDRSISYEMSKGIHTNNVMPEPKELADWISGGKYNVKAFGAQGIGTRNNSAQINDAIGEANANGGGIVLVPPGTYYIESGLIQRSKVHLVGAGAANTKIYLANGANCDMLQTYNYTADLAAMTKSSVFDFGIWGITFDGNYANQTAGRGLALYGCGYYMNDVKIFKTWGHGLDTNYNPDATVALPTGATLEARYHNITIGYNHGHGWLFKGPTDSYADGIVIYQTGNENGTIVQDGNDCGSGVPGCGLVLDESSTALGYGGSLAIGFAHIYACFGDGMWVKAGGYTKAALLELDANERRGILVERDRCFFGSIYSYKNNRELNGYYHVDLNCDETQIGALFIDHRWANTALKLDVSGGGGLRMAGSKNTVGHIKAWGAGTTSAAITGYSALSSGSKTATGVLVAGNWNSIGGGEIHEWNQGSSVGLDSGGGSVRIYNQITATIYDCVTAWKNDTGGTGSKLCHFNLNLAANEGTTGQALFAGDGPQNVTDAVALDIQDRWRVTARDSTSGSVDFFCSQNQLPPVAVDLNSAAAQTFVVPHKLLLAPNTKSIMFAFYQISGSVIPVWEYIRVSAIDATNITIICKIAGTLGAGTVGYFNVWCGVTP